MYDANMKCTALYLPLDYPSSLHLMTLNVHSSAGMSFNNAIKQKSVSPQPWSPCPTPILFLPGRIFTRFIEKINK